MCECKDFYKWGKVAIQDQPFNAMKVIQTNTNGWCHLVICPTCGQLWQVDECDKYHHDIAVKFYGNQDKWETISGMEIRKSIISANHIDVSKKERQWLGCKNTALGDMVFCVDRAYSNGIHW